MRGGGDDPQGGRTNEKVKRQQPPEVEATECMLINDCLWARQLAAHGPQRLEAVAASITVTEAAMVLILAALMTAAAAGAR